MKICPCGCQRRVKAGNTYAGTSCSKRKYPIRYCACGCQRRVLRKKPSSRWATPQCVPKAVRQAAGRRSREVYSMRRRALRFKDLCDRLCANGGRITRGDLLAAFQELANREWYNGYQSCDQKWERRLAESRKAVA
jgi:hypothetical protein